MSVGLEILEKEIFTPDTRDTSGGSGKSRKAINLFVENIHCGSCVQRIESILKKQDGILDARCNLTSKKVFIEWDENLVGFEDLYKVLVKNGFNISANYSDQDKEAKLKQKRLIKAIGVAGFGAMNVMIFSFAIWFGSDMGVETKKLFHWLQFIVAFPTIAYAGRPFFSSALEGLKHGRTNMDLPISVALILSTIMSFAVLFYGSFPNAFWVFGVEAASGQDYKNIFASIYFESSCMLLFILLVGRYWEQRVKGKAGSAAQDLLSMRVETSQIRNKDGSLVKIPASDIEPDMEIYIAAGDAIPVDGEIIEGLSELDTQMVNGETNLTLGKKGVKVLGGMVNVTSAIVMKASASEEDSFLVQVVRILEQSQQNKAKYVEIADKVAQYYAPVVHVLALVGFALALYMGAGLLGSFAILIAVLIISCPCALGLAVPIVQSCALGKLMKMGILVKSSHALERLSRVNYFLFDKTGTLSEDKFVISDIEVFSVSHHAASHSKDKTKHLLDHSAIKDLSDNEFAIVLAMSHASSHPLCKALCEYLMEHPRYKKIKTIKVFKDLKEHPGQGVELEKTGSKLGNLNWCMDNDKDSNKYEGMVDENLSQLWFRSSSDSDTLLFFGFKEKLRKSAFNAVNSLKFMGYKIKIISGDRKSPVALAASALGIKSYSYSLLPEGKLKEIKLLRQEGYKIAMVGDGINDAASLQESDLSMSFASGAVIAQNSADILLMQDDLNGVKVLVDTSKKWKAIVKQNLTFSLFYNVFAIPVAMLGFVNPIVAAVLMSCSSIVVVLNSLRISNK